jgi:lipid II:glycine glycyltransferase (peptidoglycan interpeptide bridge formation enzyme)
MVALCARHAGEPVGMLLWYAVGKVGYYHLGAFNSQGYALHASFALFWRSFEVLAQMGVRWLNLGGGAGAAPGMGDGLADFKKGWSAYSRKVYFCGRVFQPDRYAQLSSASGHPANGYFPAYRRGEFA